MRRKIKLYTAGGKLIRVLPFILIVGVLQHTVTLIPRYVVMKDKEPTRGVLFFGYHLDPVKAQKYVENIVQSARSVRKYSPELKVAIATNVESEVSILREFDDVIHINREDVYPGRQWWTRLLYMNITPYDETLSLDSDRIVCGDISSAFSYLAQYDILHVSGGILPAFDNGVIFYRKGQRFNSFLSTWRVEQVQWNQFGDDQATQARALDKSHEIRSGVLPPSWQVKQIPAVGDQWGPNTTRSRTLVINGLLRISAGIECPYPNSLNESLPRMFLQNKSKIPRHKLCYDDICCEEFLDGLCFHEEIDWSASWGIMDRNDYIATYHSSGASITNNL